MQSICQKTHEIHDEVALPFLLLLIETKLFEIHVHTRPHTHMYYTHRPTDWAKEQERSTKKEIEIHRTKISNKREIKCATFTKWSKKKLNESQKKTASAISNFRCLILSPFLFLPLSFASEKCSISFTHIKFSHPKSNSNFAYYTYFWSNYTNQFTFTNEPKKTYFNIIFFSLFRKTHNFFLMNWTIRKMYCKTKKTNFIRQKKSQNLILMEHKTYLFITIRRVPLNFTI